jgi:predicted O-methyltransferase YrrM
MRDMAISPDCAATLVSIIMELRPTTILEFGSGTSTLLCGYCLKQLGAGAIISIDHDLKYAEQTIGELREHGLAEYARVQHAALRTVSLPAGQWQWYDPAFLAQAPAVDLLIVDGPPGGLQRLARYPALPMVIGKLSPAATIVIDDANRPDEQEMVRRWVSEFPGFRRVDLNHEKGTVILRRLPPNGAEA